MKVGRMLLEWDQSEIYSGEIEFQKELRAGELEAGTLTIEKLESDVYQDTDLIDINWNDLLDEITALMEKKGQKHGDGYWKAVVKSFGWLSQNGYSYFRASNGRELLNAVLPRTECTFRIFNYGRGIAIQNFHHDSPTGNEWYYITQVAESTYERYAS